MADSARPAPSLAAVAASQPGRIQKITYEGRTLWVKRANPARGAWLYGLQSLLARIAGLRALLAPPQLGGQRALALEAGRLRALAALEVPVPEVVAQGGDWMVITHLGERTLEDSLLASAGAARFSLWRRGLDAIVQAHRRGGCLSQSFCRNMVLMPGGEIGFIDFEEDPLSVMSLAQAQTRDWALYLHSTAYLVADFPERHRAFLECLAAESAEARRETLRLLRRLGWLAALPKHPRWGRDTMRVRAAGQFAREAARLVAQTGFE